MTPQMKLLFLNNRHKNLIYILATAKRTKPVPCPEICFPENNEKATE